MDKICIVKLRKNLTDLKSIGLGGGPGNRVDEGQTAAGGTVPAAEQQGPNGAHDGFGIAGRQNEGSDRTVSLTLTPEQLDLLRLNPNLPPFFSCGAGAQGLAGSRQKEETVVLRFAFDPTPPVRLLKMDEVVQLLRISKGYLNKIIREGKLKSYRLGRLRRIKFDDVLAYLEESQEFSGIRRQDPSAKISQQGSG